MGNGCSWRIVVALRLSKGSKAVFLWWLHLRELITCQAGEGRIEEEDVLQDCSRERGGKGRLSGDRRVSLESLSMGT